MAQVGEFPDLRSVARRMIRGPVNPFDKATIVSIYPKRIEEYKWTLTPSQFIIEKGTYENPSLLVVGTACWWREIDEKQPFLEIPVSSIQVADSIINDYCNGLLGCDMGNLMPGLFFVNGELTVDMIKKQYQEQLDKAKVKQHKFYGHLVKLADSLWAKAHGNPLVVSDDMRMAARELGLESTKDWMKDFEKMDMVRCFACGSLKNPAYPVCATCRAIDPNHEMSGQIKFAS